jgi:hypothetical protein
MFFEPRLHDDFRGNYPAESSSSSRRTTARDAVIAVCSTFILLNTNMVVP